MTDGQTDTGPSGRQHQRPRLRIASRDKNCHTLYMLIVVYTSKYTFSLYYIISCMTSNNA